ncbi:MAG: low-specificity L-threonine aldolase [Xanthomonadales bacterium]|nr:low-specificity L-threonine aldolase [Xanthomonadales bacterium]
MRQAMLAAAVGDDVYGEDPTVNALQERLANDLGFAAALFLPSGTQSNLCALLAHCERGDEYLVGMEAHTYKYEGGGAAVLGSIQPQPIVQNELGCLPIESLQRALKPIDPHFARTRLVCLENTWHGRVLPADYLAQARGFCDQHGLALHLDGARLFNAAVAQATDDTDAMSAARAICGHFDSVSVCFSKGLGAPVGSVLLGEAALIERARRWRKVCGGGMRQAGLLAAACLHALDQHVAKLAEDHDRAARLAAALRGTAAFSAVTQHTNMVFVQIDPRHLLAFRQHCERGGLTVSVGSPLIRLVLHRDVDDSALGVAIHVLRDFQP